MVWNGLHLRHGLNHRETLMRQEPREGDLGEDGLLQPGRAVSWSIGHQQQYGCGRQPLDQGGKPLLGGCVHPVSILYRDNQGLTPAVMQKHLPEKCKRAGPACLWADLAYALYLDGHIKELEQQRELCRRCHSCLLYIFVHLARDVLRTIRLKNPTALAQQIAHRQIRRGAAVGEAVSLAVSHSAPAQTLGEFVEES